MLTHLEWIIVASRSQAKIFEYDELTTQLVFINSIANLEGRQKNREFGQDRLGARRGNFAKKNTAQDGGKNPHDLSADKFATLLAQRLSKAYTEKEFLKARVFAEAHLLGKIKQHVNEKIAAHIKWIAKDLAKAPTAELEKQL